MSNKYIEPIKPDYVPAGPLMPSGQPYPSAPVAPDAAPGQAPVYRPGTPTK